MYNITNTAVLGAGVIGASWTALFLAAGKDVNIYDPAEDAEESIQDYIKSAFPALEKLGLVSENMGQLAFFSSVVEAVKGVQFVQENVPERLEVKHQLYKQIEPHLQPECIVASSASGLLIKEMQAGWKNPSRFILGHPFNPPHLIPLVEILGNDKTDDDVLDIAEAFYTQMGKVTIRINKEVPGHVANRLQAAVWREAIYLVDTGVASVEDVDKAMWSGPGIRWAAMGPHMLFNLGAGAGGMNDFCERYADSFHRWWDDLGEPSITAEIAAKLSDGINKEADGKTVSELSKTRDQLIVEMLIASSTVRNSGQ